jgi:CcmD family protein
MKTLIAALLAVVSAVSLAAQPPSPQGGFVPIDQLPAAESFPAAPLVVAAYAVAWAVIFLYVWSVWRRIDRVERELKEVTARVSARARP